MLSEMNKNFDDIFVENRTPDMESIVGNSRLDL